MSLSGFCPLCLTPPCLKLKAAIFAAFFLAPLLLPQETEFNEMYRLDLGAGLHMIRNGA
jgi:hypothetical protein